MELQFQHATPAFRTYCGDRALSAIPTELDRLGVERAVLFFGASMRRHGEEIERVEAVIGPRLAGHFDGVLEHSPLPAVLDGVKVLRDARADAVIAVGGGSAVVTARAASILMAEGKDIRELCTQRGVDGKVFSPKLLEPKMPQWVVPTTGTTAFAKAGSAIRDLESGERLPLFDPKTRAQGVFFDSGLALTAPVDLAIASALNAFAMAVEGLQSSAGDPLTVALLSHALRILSMTLHGMRREPENAELRLQSMVGALLSGQGSDYAGGGLAQVLSHAAGMYSSTSNGVVEAMFLPSTMRYNSTVTKDGLALIAQAINGTNSIPEDAVSTAVSAVGEVLERAEVPSRLRDVDVAPQSFPAITEHALADWALTRVPKSAGRDELTVLLEDAW
jgi:alcohol dehydrogenase class IV